MSKAASGRWRSRLNETLGIPIDQLGLRCPVCDRPASRFIEKAHQTEIFQVGGGPGPAHVITHKTVSLGPCDHQVAGNWLARALAEKELQEIRRRPARRATLRDLRTASRHGGGAVTAFPDMTWPEKLREAGPMELPDTAAAGRRGGARRGARGADRRARAEEWRCCRTLRPSLSANGRGRSSG